MGFQKEPRYWVRRRIGTRYAYLNKNGQETIAPVLFGEQWSNGEPGLFTLNQALKARFAANADLPVGEHFEYLLTANSYNS